MSQEAFAKQINMTQQRISSYEKGKREPDIETLKQFAEFFNCTVDYIIGKSDIRNPININNTHIEKNEFKSYYDELNDLGKQKANEYVKDLTDMPKYTDKENEKNKKSKDA